MHQFSLEFISRIIERRIGELLGLVISFRFSIAREVGEISAGDHAEIDPGGASNHSSECHQTSVKDVEVSGVIVRPR